MKKFVSHHVTDNGEVVEIRSTLPRVISYIPYGEIFVEQQSGGWQSPYLFNSKELDSETGLYYYGARYLDPSEGMWLSVDPLFEKYVGMSPYQYCHNNPIVKIDPNGMWEEDANGDMIAQKGDCAWTLHEQTGMSFTRSAKHYISISVRLGFGFDIGVSGGANASWYENGPKTEKDYNPKHMGGLFWYGSFGVFASGGVSSSIISNDAKKLEKYHRWTNVSVGGGADVGGSCGIGYTWVPFTW